MCEAKDTFSFVDADGGELFTVEASGHLRYRRRLPGQDSYTGEHLAVLHDDFSFL